MAGIAESLRLDLSAPDPEFAEGYAESFLNTYIAAQIKTIRQQRKMTQDDLAGVLDTTQTVVSRIENVNYAAWSIGTLKKIARAFDVRLKVSFEEYGTLPEEIETFSKERLMRAKRTEDPRLKENMISQAELVAHTAMPAPLDSFDAELLPDFACPDVYPDLFAGNARDWNSIAAALKHTGGPIYPQMSGSVESGSIEAPPLPDLKTQFPLGALISIEEIKDRKAKSDSRKKSQPRQYMGRADSNIFGKVLKSA